MLRDLNLKGVYRSESDNLLEDFYIPALSNSIQYNRAVGFFSASMLSYAAQGLSTFIKNEGSIKLIFGGELDPDDAQAMEEGYKQKYIQEKLGDLIIHVIDNVDDTIFFKRLELLSWLITSGKLEIKFALKRQGMYHEKVGILTDGNNDQVVFQGSANETKSALLPDFNFESINVFQCWRKEFQEHYQPYIDGFEQLWSNKSSNTYVIEFPIAAKEKLIKIAKQANKPITPNVEYELWNKYLVDRCISEPTPEYYSGPQIPTLYKGEEFQVREHQKRALEAWQSLGFRGIFAHATGAGKTITAIYGLVKVLEKSKKMFVIIAVPYVNLADQWVEDLRLFSINAIKCYGKKANWTNQLGKFLSLYQSGSLDFVCVVVVNKTLQSEGFQDYLRQIPGENLLWVGDECHHHSSRDLSRALPNHANHTLGLSATPEHYINEELTSNITGYYGAIIDRYELKEALDDGVLTPYEYYPQLIELTDTESEEYYELSDKISKAFTVGGNSNLEDTEDPYLTSLLMKRARVLGSAKNKLVKLQQLISGSEPSPLTLFYCGDGSVEDEDMGESERQIEAVSNILYKYNWKTARFTSHESVSERRAVLDQFRLNILDALVAIRCLDEGIDIPACRTAYILASSRNPKQFIQRRGRILRRSPGKEKAIIFDFIVHIPYNESANKIERSLVMRELERVAEFASLAENHAHSVRSMMPLLEEYDLAHLLV